MRFPARPSRNSGRAAVSRECSGHLVFVRSHCCSACGAEPGDEANPIEAAHIRNGTDGGTGIKPSDKFTVSLCTDCHATQHRVGEPTFWARAKVDPLQLAAEFARRSRPWQRHIAKGSR